MTQQVENASGQHDPEGSIFLFERLSAREFDTHFFAMLQGRGEYRDMAVEDLEDHLRELKLRRALTEKAMQLIPSSASA